MIFDSFWELRFSYPWVQFLNIYHGIMLLSLPVSISYSIIVLLLPMHVSNLVVSIDQFLFMHTELILTISIPTSLYSWDTSCYISLTTMLLLLQQTFQKCPSLPHSAHILPYAGHCLGWWIPPQYLHDCCNVVWCTGVLVLSSFTFLNILILSNCLDSVNVFDTAAWALCTSTLLAHVNTLPLVMW